MKCTVYKLGRLKNYKYVVTFTRYNNKWVICKHKKEILGKIQADILTQMKPLLRLQKENGMKKQEQ
jgi:hypothetical protein